MVSVILYPLAAATNASAIPVLPLVGSMICIPGFINPACSAACTGTSSGIARYFKQVKHQPLYTVAVEPAESPIITQTREGKPITPGPHKIQGIGANFIPKNLALDLLDEVITVTGDDAIAWARRAMTQEGILCGISCGAALQATYQLASRPEMQGKTIVVILPDSGERYLSSVLFDGIFTGENFN